MGEPGEQYNPHEMASIDFEGNGSVCKQFDVKYFIRPDAGREMNVPSTIRPPSVLNITMQYLVNVIIDQDLLPPGNGKVGQNFIEIFEYT